MHEIARAEDWRVVQSETTEAGRTKPPTVLLPCVREDPFASIELPTPLYSQLIRN